LKGLETNLNDSIIVLDTNVLSDVFEASPDYYNFIINCLDKVKENIYLTDTIFHELSSIKNKPYTVPSFKEQKHRFLEIVKSNINKEIGAIKKLKKYEDNLTEVTILDELVIEISKKESIIKDILDKIVISKLVEPAMSNIEKNFVKELIDSIQQNGRVGESLQRSILEKVSYQAERDANNGRPFPDKNKKGITKFNDFFIVEEMKMLAKAKNNNILFVTSDVKGNFQDDRLDEDFKSETGYELRIKSREDFYSDIASRFNIYQDNITELFLSENQFDFLEELNNNNNLERIITDYLLYNDIDGENEDLEFLEVYLHDIEIDSFNDYEVSYIVTGDINAEKIFYEYWGRDDDTKEIITSPANYKSYSGNIKLFVHREFDVEDDIVITKHVDCELMDTSELEIEINTWGEYDV
jgi:hypothetical protein